VAIDRTQEKKSKEEFKVIITPYSVGVIAAGFTEKTVNQVAGRRVTRAVLEASTFSRAAVLEMIEMKFLKWAERVDQIPESELFGKEDEPPAREGLPLTDPPEKAAAPTGTSRKRRPATEGRRKARKPRKPVAVSDAVDGEGRPIEDEEEQGTGLAEA
jgi:hypothetical protein